MECPYFKKINFQRIQQRNDTQQDLSQQASIQKSYNFRSAQAQYYFEDSIPEEGLTNNVKIQNYKKINRYDSFKSFEQQQMEQSEKIITIKMPKSLKVRQLNMQSNNYTQSQLVKNKNCIVQDQFNKNLQLSRIQQQISCESIHEYQNKHAKVFQTNRSLFFQNTFYSIIQLLKTKQFCLCEMNQQALKIVYFPDFNAISSQIQTKSTQQIKQKIKDRHKIANSKIKYFVNLEKFKLELHSINDTCLQIRINGKKTKQSFIIDFVKSSLRCTFQCVYASILQSQQFKQNKLIKETNFKKNTQQLNLTISENQYNQNSESSIDSLRFTVQRINYQQAVNFLDTFDLILFKGKNIMSKFQRFFTNSQYDHVGLVMKTVTSNLLLLQATGNVGVAIYSFKSIQMALKKKLYERVAVKKLYLLNNNNFSKHMQRLTSLQQFVDAANGKKYKFDPMYLLNWSLKQKQNALTGQKVEQTYFCSELVAEALKTCQIMKKTKPSYQYLPKHFGDKSINLELQQNFRYSDSIILQR